MQRRTLSLLALLPLVAPASAQTEGEQEPALEERTLVVEPAELTLSVGQKVKLEAHVENAAGETVGEEVLFFSRARLSVSVDADGNLEALAPGEFTVMARTRRARREDGERASNRRLSAEVRVTVERLPLTEMDFRAAEALYVGTVVEPVAVALDTRGVAQRDLPVRLSSDRPEIASFDVFGRLHLHGPGAFTASAECETLRRELTLESLPNPVQTLEITGERESARTGDVIHFTVRAEDALGAAFDGVPIEVAVIARPDDALGEPASGQVRANPDRPGDWRFVAETPGLYTLVATCGDRAGSADLRVEQREFSTRLEVVGRGSVPETHTSDLWVWEGVDGRDYAVTGTWGADGEAHFWDVTDPAEMKRIATLKVDARTVNDVKVSQDGRLCVLSREGASNRKNGIVLVDVVNPAEPKILGTYDEGLTGGVHNVFVDGHHVYALSAGRRYDIIDVSDPSAPRTVGKYELSEPGHSIHDVWVENGLAYSSNWSNGVHIVDVGNGIKGGSPENPVHVGDYAYPSGWNHAAFPYKSSSTDRFYVVAGDEAFPYGLNIADKPTYPRGWLHFIDFTDMQNPREVARYEVPEAGTHNFWIEDDLAYVAYYNGGLRVVDLSGELMGDLYRQGREMAFLISDDPAGHIPNAPMVWGPQPHKGSVFFSDWNSGLWAVRLAGESSD